MHNVKIEIFFLVCLIILSIFGGNNSSNIPKTPRFT